MTDDPLEGSCACGAVRYRLDSAPLFVHCCHCLNCQRRAGSAFVINVLIETDQVEVLAGSHQPVDARDSGSVQRIFPLPGVPGGGVQPVRHPGFRFVRAGTLDDPAAVAPDVHIYTRSVPWVVLPDGVPAFDVYYKTRELWPPASLERLDAVLAQPVAAHRGDGAAVVRGHAGAGRPAPGGTPECRHGAAAACGARHAGGDSGGGDDRQDELGCQPHALGGRGSPDRGQTARARA